MKIKKYFLLIVVLVCLLAIMSCGTTSAQTKNKVGIKGGVNYSILNIDKATTEDGRFGFNAGVFGQVMSTETFALQLELLYSTKGTSVTYEDLINQDISYNLNYIDLPMLAVIKLGRSAEIHLGGYGSYLLGANVSYSGPFGNGVEQIKRDDLQTFDYGLLAGLGFNFGNLQFGLRYNYGLVKIARSNNAQYVLDNANNVSGLVFLAFNLAR